MKRIMEIGGGLLFICLLIFSCSKDNTPQAGVEVGKIKSSVDTVNCSFIIRAVTKNESGDTVSIKIFGFTKDSTNEIIINFSNVIGLKAQKYDCSYIEETGTYISVTYLAGGEQFICDGAFGKGSISVTSYNSDAIAGSFDLNAGNILDTTKVVKLIGEFNAVFDINSIIKDIDVPVGEMQARVNTSLTFFNAIAAKVSFNGEDTIINVTGTYGNESIVLQFVNLHPISGQAYTMSLDSYMNNAYIKGSYSQDTLKPFIADGQNNTTGIFTIVKIADSYIQGTFQFVGKQVDNLTHTVNITDGKYNAKINNDYQK